MRGREEELGARGYDTITAYLTADHRRIDALFVEARQAVGCGAWLEARASFADLEAGLRRHIRLEESVVFPLFEAKTRIAGPVAVMKAEHRRLESLLERATLALAEEDADRFGRAAGELDSLLHAHNLKEERILYPKTDQVLRPDERRRIAAELADA